MKRIRFRLQSIVAPKGPVWATVWSPVGSVQGTDSVPIPMPNPNCTMPEDMAHLSAICLQAKVKRDRAPLAKWQTAQYITHLLGDSLLGCKGPNLCRALFNRHGYDVMPPCHPRRRKLDLERHQINKAFGPAHLPHNHGTDASRIIYHLLLTADY